MSTVESGDKAPLEVPQWKRELIARLRSQNKRTATAAERQQLCGGPPRSPEAPVRRAGASEPVASPRTAPCAPSPPSAPAMVQDRAHPQPRRGADRSDSDSSEDLHYGPGIVSRLKNKYLSLALRETARASILPLRKAASLEHILDDAAPQERPFERRPQETKGRYRAATRSAPDVKRARSVEAISSRHQAEKPEETPLTNSGDKVPESGKALNRPLRIAPLMRDREKPPADCVKQTKRIFERRPEQRTKAPQHTGEVAAKIATYTTIIGQTRVAKKPPIKTPKPIMRHPRKDKRETQKPSITSPIPDISMIESGLNEAGKHVTSLSETPDLIMTSSPLAVSSPGYRISATEDFIREEVLHSSQIDSKGGNKGAKDTPVQSVTFDFVKEAPPNCWKRPVAVSILQPLKIEVNGNDGVDSGDGVKSPKSPVKNCVKSLTSVEIKKNFINSVKTREVPSNDCRKSGNVVVSEKARDKVKMDTPPPPPPPAVVDKAVAKLKTVSLEPVNGCSSSATMRFNFTDRKEIPNYVHNDGTIRVQPVQKPKPGEGGIIIIPGASLDESVTDEEDELMKSLEAPPSPCDVTFINDNILIDGKSSFSQKTKKARMRISFVDSHPEIYEYPSESSLLIEESPLSPTKSAQMGHAVPSLSGSSSLANYTPKGTITTDDFEPGVTRKTPTVDDSDSKKSEDGSPVSNGVVLEEAEEPVLFSSGTNSDMLF